MDFQEAYALQKFIESTYPHLDTSLKQVEDGRAWVCYLNTEQYFLWACEDWLAYERTRYTYFQRYTDVEHERLRTQKSARMKHKKRMERMLQGQ